MKYFNKVEEICPCLYEECEQKGTMERIDYKATNYDGAIMDKHAYVYLPYNYDAAQAYDILYLIHGGGETAEKYLYQDGEENKLKRAVDNMIAKGDIKPLIIVTPSPYPYNTISHDGGDSRRFTTYFHNELVLDLMPQVEGKYHTFAEFKTDEDSLKAARNHRAVMGWSMGCGTTWSIFLNRIAYFNRFGFTSGHCNVLDGDLTKEWADETAKLVVNSVKEQGFGRDDISIYAITGTLDIAFERMALLINAMKAYPETFEFYTENQNITFLTWPQGEHHTQWRLQYAINCIRQLFRAN